MSGGREGGRRELEKGLGKKYDLGRFLGAPKFKKPNTKPSLPLLLIAMRAGEIEIDGSGIGAQSPPLPTSYEMRFAQPGRDKTTCRLHSFQRIATTTLQDILLCLKVISTPSFQPLTYRSMLVEVLNSAATRLYAT